MRGTAKFLVALGGVSIWACAKANDSKLIYDGEERGGRAGAAGGAGRGGTSSGKGGTNATGSGGSANQGGSAGSSGRASGGSSGSRASGGSTSRGGSSGSGGASGRGGTSNRGGTSSGGSAASGGDAGDGGIDPDVLARAKLVLHYIAQDTRASSKSVEMRLFLENKSDDAMPLAPIEVRYWMTSEPTSRRMNSYYAAAATTSRALEFISDGDDSYVEVTFASGSLPAHTSDLNSTEFQIKLEADSNFDQSDDHSFAPTLTAQPAAPHDKVTVYVQNRLVWGCEPSGRCAGDGEGGAGGQGGEGGGAGATGEAGASAGGGGGVPSGEGGQAGEPAATGGQGGDATDGGAAGAIVN